MSLPVPRENDYPTCSYTHVWLRVMHKDLDPIEISRILNLQPTKTQIAGTAASTNSSRVFSKSGWFLESAGVVDSRDARNHLDWLLAQLKDKESEFSELRNRDYLIDICCRWESSSGHGGPTISPQEMGILASLGIELWFDIYFDNDSSHA